MTPTTYVSVAPYVVPLESGRPVAPGETVQIDDPESESAVRSGQLVEASEQPADPRPSPRRRKRQTDLDSDRTSEGPTAAPDDDQKE